MDFVAWIWWAVAKTVGLIWSILWFLLGGWVATLAQIAVIGLIVYGYKFGWRRAPIEVARHAKAFGSFVWAWVRTRDMAAAASAGSGSHRADGRGLNRAHRRDLGRRKEIGDVNVSTLLSVVALFGLGLVAFA